MWYAIEFETMISIWLCCVFDMVWVMVYICLYRYGFGYGFDMVLVLFGNVAPFSGFLKGLNFMKGNRNSPETGFWSIF